MNHELDEVDAVPRRVGLYNVKYRYNNEEHVTVLLLNIGKHNKNLIKKIISKQVNIPFRSISGIKLKFRKQDLNYHSGYEGTRKYFDDLGLEREWRKRKGIEKRFTHATERNIHTTASQECQHILDINLLPLMNYMQH